MNGAFHVGGIGLASQQRALDTIANNIANLNTQSFKRSSVRFSEIMTSRANSANFQASPTQTSDVAGVSTDVKLMLEEQGQIQQTGSNLDFAIEGQGFVELMGPRGQSYLWRGGTLEINDDGFLSSNGMTLRSMINIPRESNNLQISPDGTVFSQISEDAEATEIGQIMLVKPENMADMERVGSGLYRIDNDASIVEAMPNEDGMGTLVQGSTERSNVDLNTEMVQMMIVQRAYAANAQIVQAADQMMAIANNLRR